jgi:hypothetical protein
MLGNAFLKIRSTVPRYNAVVTETWRLQEKPCDIALAHFSSDASLSTSSEAQGPCHAFEEERLIYGL